MTRTVRLSRQVLDYLRRLSPGTRQAIRQGLRELAGDKGDIRALDGALSGYYRLRIGRYRIVFAYASDASVEAVFLEDRSLVYEVFEAQFVRRLVR